MNYCVVNHEGIIENGHRGATMTPPQKSLARFPATKAPGSEIHTSHRLRQPTALDRLEAQVTYTAMMTDTLMEG